MTYSPMAITDHDDLLIEILLCLPAKSLIRFKLVCKSWFYIISGRHFSIRHTLHHRPSKPEPSFLLRLANTWDHFYLHFSTLYGAKLVSYRFLPTLNEPTILSVSNGLFLLQCRNVLNPLEDSCHIYNPTTKQSRKILLYKNERYTCLMGLNLAFDPLVSPHYKIICIRSARRRSSNFLRGWWRRCLVEVYESDTCTWKLCGEPFVASRDMDFNNGIYWKGGIHWHGMFFNLRDSCIEKHPDVVVPGEVKFCYSYVESNGSLHYVTHLIEKELVMVFELQSDYSQWLLKYDHINIDRPFSVLSIVRGDSEENGMLLLHEPADKVMAYMFQEKRVKELVDFREESFYKEHCVQFVPSCTFQYIETLAPV